MSQSVSSFGGHPLTAQSDALEGAAANDENGQDAVGNLATTLGIEDAEQLVALVAVPGIKAELSATLGVSDEDLEALIDQATQALPIERLATVSAATPGDLALGALLPTNEMVDAATASAGPEAMDSEAAPVALPAFINLVSFMSPIRNQGGRGTCVAFTLTALNEYILRRRGLVRDLSEQHLYFETKLIDGASAQCGTWQAKAVLPLLSRGECIESIWPYVPTGPCNNHGALPAQARPNGQNSRLSTIAVPARNVQTYKAHMARQRAVTLSFPVYNSWYRSAETARSGRITMPVGNEAVVGGHAVCLVGYVDTAASPGGGYFIVRNSWSTGWASASPFGAGYGTIPYAYIATYAYEAYTAIVPSVGDVTEEEDETETVTSQSTITIEVKPNITITIATH